MCRRTSSTGHSAGASSGTRQQQRTTAAHSRSMRARAQPRPPPTAEQLGVIAWYAGLLQHCMHAKREWLAQRWPGGRGNGGPDQAVWCRSWGRVLGAWVTRLKAMLQISRRARECGRHAHAHKTAASLPAASVYCARLPAAPGAASETSSFSVSPAATCAARHGPHVTLGWQPASRLSTGASPAFTARRIRFFFVTASSVAAHHLFTRRPPAHRSQPPRQACTARSVAEVAGGGLLASSAHGERQAPAWPSGQAGGVLAAALGRRR